MPDRLVVLRHGMVVAACLLISLIGCGSANRSGLPESVTLELLDGTIIEVEQGAGAASLANSQWQLFRTSPSAQSLAFVTINFGPEGNLESFENNTLAQEIFGDTILFDGQRHNTSQQALQYAAATFGAETDDATGFTFEGRLAAFAAGIQVATATATTTASYDPNDPDTVEGTFTFSSRATISSIPNGNTDFEFTFVGRRVTDGQ
jgi:hypothetical protein